jgi:oligoribonuclease (3'-5' exoribonuclease)
LSPDIVERDIIGWLDNVLNRNKRKGPVEKFKFMLAGSGVEHFDRRFLKAHMPKLAAMLTWTPLDVGDVRRLASMAGYKPSGAAPQADKNHRAEDDIRMHLEEARAYYDVFRKLAQQTELESAVASGSIG